MVSSEITGRDSVFLKSTEEIERFRVDIKKLISGKEDFFLYAIMVPPSISSRISEEVGGAVIKYDVLSWRNINAFTLGLNKILPDFLPMKTFDEMRKETQQTISREEASSLYKMIIELGKWNYVKRNGNIHNVKIEDDTLVSGLYRGQYQSLGEYVKLASNDTEEIQWLSSFYKSMLSDGPFLYKLENASIRKYGFLLRDLWNVSISIGKLVKKNDRFIDARSLRSLFQKSVEKKCVDQVYDHLIFKKGRLLQSSPLIPLECDNFLIADWIFNLNLRFDFILRDILDSTELRGYYAQYIGHKFENYVISTLKDLVSSVNGPIEIKAKQYPSIGTCLHKLHKSDGFEIDIVVVLDSHAFLISCKGGKKAPPKFSFSRFWAEYPENEILSRIEENMEEMEEIYLEVECVKNDNAAARFFGVEGKHLHPMLVYSSPQPLCFENIRKEFKANFDVPITTPLRLFEKMNEIVKLSVI